MGSMVQVSGIVRHHRVAIASSLALLVATAGVVVAAVSADGYRAHEAELNDGGIWVTNSRDGFYGRVNKPIGQLDAAIYSELNAQLDIVQDGAAVVGINVSAGVIAPIDPAGVLQPEGETAQIPGSAQVQMLGGTIAVLDPSNGSVWAEAADPLLGSPLVGNLDSQAPALAKLGNNSALAVTESGAILVASADTDALSRLERKADGFGAPRELELASNVGPAISVTSVGETAVVLDSETGSLEIVGGPSVDVPANSVLQQPGTDAAAVLVATSDRLLWIDLETGAETVVADGVSGRPSAPVHLGGCDYGAWSGGLGAVVTRCGEGEPPVVNSLGPASSDLVLRVNRGEILLNDRASGAIWNIDSDQPTRLDNWDAFKSKVTEKDENDENEQIDTGDRRPPEAKPDQLGARLGRTTVLHPLDNDTAPEGRILAIRSVKDITGSDAAVTISPDGQTVQIRMPDEAPTTRFEYYVDDGREGVSANATVTVTPRPESVNAPPEPREGFEPRVWTVPSGGTLDVAVLPDWRDNQDGDPLSVAAAEASGGERSGAVSRVTSSGRIRFTAPVQSGLVIVNYDVSDGVGEIVSRPLKIRVQDLKDRRAFPASAESDVVAGEAGKPITIRPLANDLPGSDPVTPNAVLELAGKVAEVAGAEVRTDLVAGTITFRAAEPKTYFLDYDAKYGNAPFDGGRIRVDVRDPQRSPQEPVAIPDNVSLYGQSATLADVLANDIDPAGGMLVVQSAQAQSDNQIDVAVVDGRWLRLSVRQGQLSPNPQLVTYTISNGTRSGVKGEVVVTQRPEPNDNTPVTETDRVVVRAGGGVSIPVLDNDFSPSGDELGLVSDVAGEDAGQLTVQPPGERNLDTGEAFVAGRFVRYVAPSTLADAETFTVRYLASNTAGETTPGTAEITVIPIDRPNQLPEPPTLEGRAVAGDTLRLKLPGAGVDPDGDAVTLTGISSAPALGRIVSYGANSLQYQAYPGSVGTDEFTYSVIDPQGGEGSGTVRVAVVPPGALQPPLAVPDTITVEPGRTASIDVLANDLVAALDRVTIKMLSAPDGVTLASLQGPVVIDSPAEADGRIVEAVYQITNGLDTSQASVTLRTSTPFNNPPVVFDAFGKTADGDSVTVDILKTAYDPDGETSGLRITDVYTPDGVRSSINGGSIKVQRAEQPQVVPFRVRDADGGATTASLYVPPLTAGAPYVKAGALIKLDSGASRSFDLADYVVDPAGGPVAFTLKNRIWSSPATNLAAAITGDGEFDLRAAERYTGPGAVVFEVTTGDSVDDTDAVRAVLSVPVQVGVTSPILRCPDEPIELAQGQSIDVEIASVCHVWTPDPKDAAGLSFDSDWDTSVDGLSIIEPTGSAITVAAGSDAEPGITATMLVTTGGSDPGRIRFVVVESPPPSLSPIRIDDMRAGESRTIDLAPYLRPGVDNPVPTVIDVEQLTNLDVTIAKSGESGITVRTDEKVDGRAQFLVVMSDVAGSPGPERLVEGRISVNILDVPDAPSAPVPGEAVRDEEVVLGWRAPEANGAPIDRYELRGSGGVSATCGTTTCEVGGLTNGKPYTFEVRAHNAVGWSDWSRSSAPATPDAKPGLVGTIKLVREGDRTLTIAWTPPTTRTSDIRRYHVSWPGGSRISSRPTITITGLDNNVKYPFSVAAENARFIGPARRSATFQPVGTPGTPAAPTITDQQTAGDSGAVTVSWPAVNPNGPTPVRYTVLRNGTALPACTGIVALRCDNSGITYDGATYLYSIRATNKNGEGKTATGPGTEWAAVGVPAAWGGWSWVATGQNAEARADYTVPASRGARSIVRIHVSGTEPREFEAVGVRSDPFGVPSNDTFYSVFLEVCNESGACSSSSTQVVQTYGPLVDAHVLDIRPNPNGTQVSWSFTVDTNGDPASVRITSNKGRNQNFDATGVDVQSFTSNSSDIGYSATETVTVTVFDTNPSRGSGSRSTSYTSPPAPPPPPPPTRTISVSRGSACNDGGSNPCPGSNPCFHPSCGLVQITSRNFTGSTMTCDFYDSAEGRYITGDTVPANTTWEGDRFFGFPDRSVWVICDGVESNHYDWPNS